MPGGRENDIGDSVFSPGYMRRRGQKKKHAHAATDRLAQIEAGNILSGPGRLG
jgi:hypothetical protein